MPILLLLLLIGVLAYLYWQRRTTSLTKNCRWRQNRAGSSLGKTHFICVSCGGAADTEDGSPPQYCAAQQSNGRP